MNLFNIVIFLGVFALVFFGVMMALAGNHLTAILYMTAFICGVVFKDLGRYVQ